ncbi:MAG: type II toxin-antitoxin system HicB family antitoxin [Bacillota bacterium]|jgi:predicted RNase H-like HicB family nuclease|nr:toxin-antitoxin system HicB family antitoxin [Thermoanaerobacteraceae bacterium]
MQKTGRQKTDHKYQIVLRFIPEDDLWVAAVPELPGCSTHGKTRAEALANIEEAIDEWVATAQEKGWPIPAPKTGLEEYSGRFVVRLPKSLHRQLARLAEAEGVSLNQYVVYLLSVNASMPKFPRVQAGGVQRKSEKSETKKAASK